jgi:hypothetical protein
MRRLQISTFAAAAAAGLVSLAAVSTSASAQETYALPVSYWLGAPSAPGPDNSSIPAPYYMAPAPQYAPMAQGLDPYATDSTNPGYGGPPMSPAPAGQPYWLGAPGAPNPSERAGYSPYYYGGQTY